jgi:hypothetical protein
MVGSQASSRLCVIWIVRSTFTLFRKPILLDDAILDYQVPQLDEAYIEPIGAAVAPGDIPFRSLLDLQPQPMFTDRRVPPFHK